MEKNGKHFLQESIFEFVELEKGSGTFFFECIHRLGHNEKTSFGIQKHFSIGFFRGFWGLVLRDGDQYSARHPGGGTLHHCRMGEISSVLTKEAVWFPQRKSF